MSANVGTIDRILRLVIGIVLIVLPFVTGFALWTNPLWMYGSVIVGAVLVGTAAIRFCPLYRLFGMRTCPR